MLISEILESNPHLKRIDYSQRLSHDEIESIVDALVPYVGYHKHEVTSYHVAMFHKAMANNSEEIEL